MVIPSEVLADRTVGAIRSVVALDNKRHELMDVNIELRAERARLRAPEMIQEMIQSNHQA